MKRMVMTIWMVVTVLAIGGVSLGAEEAATQPTTQTATQPTTQSATQPAGRYTNEEIRELLSALSSSEEMENHSVEFYLDVLETVMSTYMTRISMSRDIYAARDKKKKACVALMKRITDPNVENDVRSFLETFAAANVELEQAEKKRATWEEAEADKEIQDILKERAQMKAESDRSMEFFVLSLGILFFGCFLGFKVMRNRNCPRCMADLLPGSVVPLLFFSLFLLSHTDLLMVSWSNSFLLIYLIWPMIVALLLRDCVLIDAKRLRDMVMEEISGRNYTPFQVTKVVLEMTFRLANPRGRESKPIKYPIEASNIIGLLKKLMKHGENLKGSSRKSVFAFIESAIKDPKGMKWDGYRWIPKETVILRLVVPGETPGVDLKIARPGDPVPEDDGLRPSEDGNVDLKLTGSEDSPKNDDDTDPSPSGTPVPEVGVDSNVTDEGEDK
jgi:hypothetical protein